MSRFLALEFDPSGLLVATATASRGGIKLERVLTWPDGEPQPTSPAELGARLKEVLKAAKISPAPVLVCLPRDKVVLKDVRHPPAPPQQEPAVVRFQAKKELAGAENDLLMDYLPVPTPPGAEDRRATVVFVNKQVYRDVLITCEAAGLKLAAVTPRSFCTAAAYRRAVASAAAPPPEEQSATVALLSLTDRGGEFTVIQGQQIPFTRSISAAALATESSLVGEIKRNLATFVTQNPGSPIQAIYLTEGSVAGRSWVGRLQTSLPVPVYPFDPTMGAANSADVSEIARGRFVGVVGLLALRGESEKLPINFLAPRSPKAEPSKARTGILLGVLLLVVLLAAGGGLGYWYKKKREREFESLQAELSSLNSSGAANDIELKKLSAMNDFVGRRIATPDLLYDIAILFPTIDPDKMQLIEYSYKPHKTPTTGRGPNSVPKGPTPPPGGAPKAGGSTGSALTGLPGSTNQKPVAAKIIGDLTLIVLAQNPADIEKFKDALDKDEKFGKITSKINGSTAGSGDRTSYEITAEVMPWAPKEFTRKLQAAFPVPPKAPDVEPEQPIFFPEDLPGGLEMPGGNAP